jgi:hypothetical protein
VPGQVGVDAVLHHDLGFGGRCPGRDQQRVPDALQPIGWKAWHTPSIQQSD